MLNKLTSRVFALFIATIAASIYCNGQTKWVLDAHGGLAVTRMWTGGNYTSNAYYFQLAPAAGFGITYQKVEEFALRGELNYDDIRSKRDGLLLLRPGTVACLPAQTGYYAFVSNTISLKYIAANVLGRFYFGDKLNLYAEAGPYAAVILSSSSITAGKSLIYKNAAAKDVVTADGIHPLPQQVIYYRQSMQAQVLPVNIGASTALGMQLPFVNNRYGFVVRYTFGIINIARKPTPGQLCKTDQLLLSLSYRL